MKQLIVGVLKKFIISFSRLGIRKLNAIDGLLQWYRDHGKGSWKVEFVKKAILANISKDSHTEDLEQILQFLSGDAEMLEIFKCADELILRRFSERQDFGIKNIIWHMKRIPSGCKTYEFLSAENKRLLAIAMFEVEDPDELFRLGCEDENLVYSRYAELIARESDMVKLVGLLSRYGSDNHYEKRRDEVKKRLKSLIQEGGEKALIEFLVESYQK